MAHTIRQSDTAGRVATLDRGLHLASAGLELNRDSTVRHLLFLCNQNRLRSPTAERIFRGEPGLEVRSAGVDADAVVPLTRDLLEWADLVLVMEKRQRNLIQKRYPDLYQTRRIVCIYIPDEFEFLDPALIALLRERAGPYLAE